MPFGYRALLKMNPLGFSQKAIEDYQDYLCRHLKFAKKYQLLSTIS